MRAEVSVRAGCIVTLLTSVGEDYGRVSRPGRCRSGWSTVCRSARDLRRGIAQMMRVGLFKPVHVKTQASQEKRMLLTARKLVQRKMLDAARCVMSSLGCTRCYSPSCGMIPSVGG